MLRSFTVLTRTMSRKQWLKYTGRSFSSLCCNKFCGGRAVRISHLELRTGFRQATPSTVRLPDAGVGLLAYSLFRAPI